MADTSIYIAPSETEVGIWDIRVMGDPFGVLERVWHRDEDLYAFTDTFGAQHILEASNPNEAMEEIVHIYHDNVKH